MRPVTSLAMALGLLVAPVAAGHARAAAGPTQTNATGSVTVAVTPLPHAAGEPLALKVALDTHSVDLDGIAFDRAVAVRTAAGPVAPLRIESAKGSGHHREAVVVFAPSALPQGAAVLEVVVKDVGGVAERLFRWDVPFEAAQAETPAPTPAAGAGPSGAGAMGPGGGGGVMGGGMMSGGMMGGGMMGPGMMAGMQQQMMGMMQQMGGMMQIVGELMAAGKLSPEQTKQVGELLQQMGGMMGEMRPMGGGQTAPGTGAARPGGMPDMSKMMERMAEMQKRMAEMQKQMSDVTGAPR